MVRKITNERGRVKLDGEREKYRAGWKGKEGCERLMRESEKLILTSLWAGRLRKIREIERGRERWSDNFYCMP